MARRVLARSTLSEAVPTCSWSSIVANIPGPCLIYAYYTRIFGLSIIPYKGVKSFLFKLLQGEKGAYNSKGRRHRPEAGARPLPVSSAERHPSVTAFTSTMNPRLRIACHTAGQSSNAIMFHKIPIFHIYYKFPARPPPGYPASPAVAWCLSPSLPIYIYIYQGSNPVQLVYFKYDMGFK